MRVARRGFTLVELLVVIAIVALLVSLLIPGLSGARKACLQARELAAAQQLMAAYALYAQDSRGAVLVGFPTPEMVAGPLVVTDESGERLTGELARRYPWRLAPYLDFNFRGLYKDYRYLEDLRASQTDYRYVVSLFPTLGLNGAFVGGSSQHLAFHTTAMSVYGRFYVSRIDEPRRADSLIVFASTRSETQAALPSMGRPEGYFRADPPSFTARNWQAAYDPQAPYPGVNSGFVACRWFGKAVVGVFDGHAESLGWEPLNDMRRWADRARSAEWRLGQN